MKGEECGECAGISQVIPTWIIEVGDSYQGDPVAEKLIWEQTLKPEKNQDWEFRNRVLKYQGKLFIGGSKGVRQKKMQGRTYSASRVVALPKPQYSWSHITMEFIKGYQNQKERML
ncbi:hypothetical protein ACH5RR_013286 [Cinchona calisaya]|uniref:Uncharacterized protein n=1 Tax=Cinchona calisaya TaxID=153742 RepID=A0ABD3A0Y2_9GENT